MEQSAQPRTQAQRGPRAVAVILLSLVAVLTAWCGFESAKWGGDSSVAFSEASAARIEAADFDSQARDARGFDLAVYSQWVVARGDGGDIALADYIEARFSPEFAVAFDAWMADGQRESGPFRMPEIRAAGHGGGRGSEGPRGREHEDALDFNEKGDNYSLMTVMFALVLFLAAIAQRGGSLLATRIVLGLAGVLALTGLVVLFTFPIRL